jgi:hypothetical protein
MEIKMAKEIKSMDTEFDIPDMEKAFELAEFYTSLDWEVSTPKSYDGGKSYQFVVSWAQ